MSDRHRLQQEFDALTQNGRWLAAPGIAFLDEVRKSDQVSEVEYCRRVRDIIETCKRQK